VSDHARESRRSQERRHLKSKRGRPPDGYGDDEDAGRSRPRLHDDEDALFNWRRWRNGDDSGE